MGLFISVVLIGEWLENPKNSLIGSILDSGFFNPSPSNYEGCQASANAIYRERLEEAINDPSLWQLVGDRNAREYAERSRKIVMANCY